MRIDHLVIGADKKYQEDSHIIDTVCQSGFPYVPKKGKKARGFKVSNIWIGETYLEMFHISNPDNAWIEHWANQYLNDKRGLFCLMLEVDNIEELYQRVLSKGIAITKPERFSFKWLFMKFNSKWRNSYLPTFDNVLFQIGFQQLDNEKVRENARKRMHPNSSENGITGIKHIECYGAYTNNDINVLKQVFEEQGSIIENGYRITINNQTIDFVYAKESKIHVYTNKKTTTSTLAFKIEDIYFYK